MKKYSNKYDFQLNFLDIYQKNASETCEKQHHLHLSGSLQVYFQCLLMILSTAFFVLVKPDDHSKDCFCLISSKDFRKELNVSSVLLSTICYSCFQAINSTHLFKNKQKCSSFHPCQKFDSNQICCWPEKCRIRAADVPETPHLGDAITFLFPMSSQFQKILLEGGNRIQQHLVRTISGLRPSSRGVQRSDVTFRAFQRTSLWFQTFLKHFR